MRLQELLEQRAQELREWLNQHGSHCWNEQEHLTDGSSEQVYWHFGYFSAIQDVLKQLSKPSQ